MTTNKPDMMLWLSDTRGQYIPQDFANSFADRSKSVSSVRDVDWTTLEDGPDNEWYWDAWDRVCTDAMVTDEHGNKYTIWQDGDCWLVPIGMEWNDENGTFAWPSDEDEETE